MAQPNPQSFRYIVGRNIAKFRTQRGLSQDDLEVLTGIDRAAISKYENGSQSMSIDRLNQFANALGVSPRDLVDTSSTEPYALFAQISQQLKELSPSNQKFVLQMIADTANLFISRLKNCNQR